MANIDKKVGAMTREAKAAAGTVVSVTALMWGIELVDLVLGGRLDALGVRPRSVAGLWGILFAPFLHAGLGHLVANTLGGVPLALLSMSRKRMDFWVVSAISAVTAGLGAWLFGAPGTVHIGASGVIFGLFGFLLSRGIFERRLGAVLVSLLVGAVFGGMVWGVVPGLYPGVSWQSHLFGFLGGLLAARSLGQGLRGKR